MKIEEGKFYRTRDGRRIFGIEKYGTPAVPFLGRLADGCLGWDWVHIKANGEFFTPILRGKFQWPVPTGKIVAEWTEEDATSIPNARIEAAQADEAMRQTIPLTITREVTYSPSSTSFEVDAVCAIMALVDDILVVDPSEVVAGRGAKVAAALRYVADVVDRANG